MSYSSGYLARELGLGTAGVLPSRPDLPLVLHGNQSLEALTKILGMPATDEDLAAAKALAEKNKPLDEFTRQTLHEGARYGRSQQTTEIPKKRKAGMILSGAGGAAGLIALIQALQTSEDTKNEIYLQ